MNLTVRPVTALANGASAAPVRPAGYAWRYAHEANLKLNAERLSAVLLALLTLSCHRTVLTPTGIPVLVGDHPEIDACNSWAVPKVDDDTAQVEVHSGPGHHFPVVDHLTRGCTILICSRSDDGRWQGIVYPADGSQSSAGECGVSSPIAPKQAYSGPCRSGWIPIDAFEVTAG